MNFFTNQSAAERYAQSRPYFHPIVISRLRERLGLRSLIDSALDVACGTGQSTTALQEIAIHTIGVDVSREMLSQTVLAPSVRYLQAQAEKLPFAEASFGLITTALAFHWFNRDRFLQEAHRVLKPGGWLIVYTNGFTSIMEENSEFQPWSRETYVERYPTPPRDSRPITPSDAESHGFKLVDQERFTNQVTFSAEELTRYLLTQTNVINAIEGGRETLQGAYEWVKMSVRPFFADARGTFRFASMVWYLRKIAHERK